MLFAAVHVSGLAVRPEGAITGGGIPPRELSIDLEADERSAG
jgi:hypothetical protein